MNVIVVLVQKMVPLPEALREKKEKGSLPRMGNWNSFEDALHESGEPLLTAALCSKSTEKQVLWINNSSHLNVCSTIINTQKLTLIIIFFNLITTPLF